MTASWSIPGTVWWWHSRLAVMPVGVAAQRTFVRQLQFARHDRRERQAPHWTVER